MMKRFLSMIAVLMLMLAAIIPAGMSEEVQEFSLDPFEEITAEFMQAEKVEPYPIALKPARVTGWVNLRWAPSKSTEIMATYKQNDKLLVIRETNNWYQVEDQDTGDVGFISKQYVVQ